jgi:hypothetical protein
MSKELMKLERWKVRRRKKIEPYIDLAGSGLEIGAGYMPLYPKDMGYNVKTLDHVSEEELRHKYDKELRLQTSGTGKVDFIFHVPGLKPPPLGGQLLA